MNIKYSLLLFLFLIQGCTPVPHTEYYAPKITGVITMNGVPASKIKLYMGSAIKLTSCETNPITVTTNQNGEFDIGPIKELKYFSMLYGDSYAIWELCAEFEGQRKRILYLDEHSTPRNLNVKCNLVLTEDSLIKVDNYNMLGKCKLNDS